LGTLNLGLAQIIVPVLAGTIIGFSSGSYAGPK